MRITSRGEYGVRRFVRPRAPLRTRPGSAKADCGKAGHLGALPRTAHGRHAEKRVGQERAGALGGYELVQPPHAVRIGDVLRALEGPIMTQSDSEAAIQDDIHRQALSALWQRIDDRINQVLDDYTLADLLDKVEDLRADTGALMWHI